MSVLSSIPGEDPKAYLDPYGGEEEDPLAWLDVSYSTVSPRCRLILQSFEGAADIILDAEGVRELLRRLNEVAARI